MNTGPNQGQVDNKPHKENSLEVPKSDENITGKSSNPPGFGCQFVSSQASDDVEVVGIAGTMKPTEDLNTDA